jgi:hypothetical protein
LASKQKAKAMIAAGLTLILVVIIVCAFLVLSVIGLRNEVKPGIWR